MVTDPSARGDLQGGCKEREQLVDDPRNIRVLDVRRDCPFRSPAIDNIENIGLVRLLIEMVIEASSLQARRFH